MGEKAYEALRLFLHSLIRNPLCRSHHVLSSKKDTVSKQSRNDEYRDGESNNIASLNALDTLDNAGSLLEEALKNSVPVVSIIIPAFNEIGTIDNIVNAIRALPVHKQIVVVDDGSTDGTRDYIANLSGISGIDVCLHDRNSGKGALSKVAFRERLAISLS